MSWPVSCLGDVSEFIRNGASIPQSKDAGGVPITRIESISERVFNQNKCGYAGVGDSEYLEYRLRLGDILVSHINSEKHLAKCVIFEDEGFDVIHGMNLLCARPDQQKIFPRFLFHYLSSPKFLHLIPAITKKSVNQASFTVTAFKELPIPLPPLPEQKRIAAILDKADSIRRKRQQAIQLADDFLRAVFLDMFGDPVTNPKGWPLKRFGDVGTWSSGGTPSRTVSDFFEGEINWYSAGELNSRYLDGSVEKISESAIKNSAAKIFKKDSLLVGMYDTAAMKISILKEDSSCNQACANVECNELASVEWLYSYIDYAKDSYLSRRRGVRQKNLNLGMIRDFLLPLPPRDLQDEFVRFVAAVFGMKKKQDEYKDFPVFESLSLKAFSGQL